MVKHWQHNVTLYQLRIFLAVLRHRNYTHAAEELHLSQPAVSAQVHELERLLGLALFEQVGKRLVPTQAALVLEEHARKVMAEIEAAADALESLHRIEAGRLTLVASTTIGNYLLPSTLALFHRRYPRVEIELAIANSQVVYEEVRTGRRELGLIESQIDSVDETLLLTPYRQDELVLIVPPWHPWAHLESVPLAALREVTLLWREPGSGTRSVVEAAFEQVGIQPTVTLELSSNEAIKRAVAANMGVAIISQAAVAAEVTAGWLSTVRIGDTALRRTLHLVQRRAARLSPVAQAFLALLLEPAAAQVSREEPQR
ncbi:LysR family transcriptional regulator [Thermogemmatispora sp.]|uniref:LysR family transcriptional regulator n=1 Tax=Thermogemmatispora sp. TaxID=1968838 RepID=UPI001D56215E|nr:LysR family transcriptional regulator [Thermogemmatispora sp.]MBX5450578.1 LysR family transcriptional regulator [Thermogemmatispora sp.]